MNNIIFLCFHIHDTSFEVIQYGKRSAHAFDCVLAKIDGHLNRMHSYDKSVLGVNSSIRLRNSNTLHITSVDNWSFLLKQIPKDELFWFTWFWMVIPTISLSFTSRKVYSMRSFTLGRKFPTGSLLSEGVIIEREAAFLQHCTAYTLSWSYHLSRNCVLLSL